MSVDNFSLSSSSAQRLANFAPPFLEKASLFLCGCLFEEEGSEHYDKSTSAPSAIGARIKPIAAEGKLRLRKRSLALRR